MTNKVVSYLDQLSGFAGKLGVDLRHAFLAARINPSTYYRATKGTTELRFRTALRVGKSIDHLFKSRRRSASHRV